MIMKEFSIVFGILLIAIWIYLLLLGRISQLGLVALLGATVIAMAVMYNIDNVMRIGMRTGDTEALVEMREIRDEVYAKAESVRSMGEEIAEVVAYSASRLGRLVGSVEEFDRELLEGRDRLSEMLKNLGSSPTRIEKIISQIEEVVALDLANAIVGEIAQNIKRQEILDKTRQLLMESNSEEIESEVRSYLEDEGVWDDKLGIKVASFARFRRTGLLSDTP